MPQKAEWITNQSVWWGIDGIDFDIIHYDFEADLAVAKLKGDLAKLNFAAYPTFANPKTTLANGASLCRLGFPFHEVTGGFDDGSKQFAIDNMPPLSIFPNEGIHTRIGIFEDVKAQRQIHHVETSSAGLRGQSGGPVFDVNGTVWGIQSKTASLPLGFAPKIKHNGKEITEHQFMHVGLAVHVMHACELMEKHKITFQSA
jgi:S1-C subfamily serine protease